MNLRLENKKHFLYMTIFYFGLVLFLSVFISERSKPFEDGLAVTVFYGGYLAFIGGIIFALRDVSVSFMMRPMIRSRQSLKEKLIYSILRT